MPGIHTEPPDTRVEAEHSEQYGRLIILILTSGFAVVFLTDLIGIVKTLMARITKCSNIEARTSQLTPFREPIHTVPSKSTFV